MATMYYGVAAGLGSETGCFNLAMAHACGRYGVPKDEVEAKRWYEKMPGCAVKCANDARRQLAREWLQQH